MQPQKLTKNYQNSPFIIQGKKSYLMQRHLMSIALLEMCLFPQSVMIKTY